MPNTNELTSLPNDRAVTLDDARTWDEGQVVRMHYNSYHEGDFLWRHTRVEGDRLVGRFASGGKWSEEGDFLYEFEGVICWGSGAEPCWLMKLEPEEGW